MQNKPNLLAPQMNVTSFYTVDYENIANWNLVKTKPIKANTNPIQSQYKPNSRKAKMKLNFYSTKDYENETAFGLRQNKPNQTQFFKIPDNFSSRFSISN